MNRDSKTPKDPNGLDAPHPNQRREGTKPRSPPGVFQGPHGCSWSIEPLAYLELCLLGLIAVPEEIPGLVAELYYVREGVINSYALDFIVPVPANFTFIYFTWHSLIKRPMQYMAHIEYDNGEAMALPQLNISNKGVVPIRPETFK
ncbi:tyrosine-protein kinase Drl-like [Penaeus vannamei]|uniref:tyrosine-protein kinase Drl-like n=1 Tax=Penaeus vannamei TaxID=6689 RepID=UPI00387F59FE